MTEEQLLDAYEAAAFLGMSYEAFSYHLWGNSKSPLPKNRIEGSGGQARFVWTKDTLRAWDESRRKRGWGNMEKENATTVARFVKDDLQERLDNGEIRVYDAQGHGVDRVLHDEDHEGTYILALTKGNAHVEIERCFGNRKLIVREKNPKRLE